VGAGSPGHAAHPSLTAIRGCSKCCCSFQLEEVTCLGHGVGLERQLRTSCAEGARALSALSSGNGRVERRLPCATATPASPCARAATLRQALVRETSVALDKAREKAAHFKQEADKAAQSAVAKSESNAKEVCVRVCVCACVCVRVCARACVCECVCWYGVRVCMCPGG